LDLFGALAGATGSITGGGVIIQLLKTCRVRLLHTNTMENHRLKKKLKLKINECKKSNGIHQLKEYKQPVKKFFYDFQTHKM